MVTTIRTKEPRELLSLIPYQLGFRPRESAVVISLRSPRGRAGLVARVDLPDLADPQSGPQVARSLVRHLVADGAAGVVLALYTDQDAQQGPGLVTATRCQAHLDAAAEHFVGSVQCWVVGPLGYYALGCVDRACCPPGGRPHADLESTRTSAEMVLHGAGVVPSRDDLGRVPDASADARRSTRRAASRWTSRGARCAPGSELARWRRDGLTLWRQELARALDARSLPDEDRGRRTGDSDGVAGTVGPTTLGRLQAALADVLIRDAVLLSFVDGTDQVGDRVVAGDPGAEVGLALRAIIDPEHGTPPDRVRTGAARQVLRLVVAHSARSARAPSLTLLAVLSWWEGDGARASVLLEQALRADEGYRLAHLVTEALDRGMPPGWLRARGGRGDAG